MTTFAEDLRTFITGTTAVTGKCGTRVHYNHIPQTSPLDHVWYRITSDVEDRTFDKAGGLHEATVDIECVADDEGDAQDLGDAVRARLDGYQGTMGNIKAQGLFITDKDDGYEPRSDMSDEGRSVVALNLRAFYST